jgi:uncharacterized protein (DUF58 family)
MGGGDFDRLLKAAARRHDIVCVPVSDPAELKIPNVGLVELEDPESGALLLVDTSSAAVRRKFAEKAELEQSELLKFFARNGIDTLSVSTDRAYIDEIRSLFKRRARKR